MDLRENSELGRMPSVIFGIGDQNDQKTWLICSGLDDPICTKDSEIMATFNYDYCAPTTQVGCIADVWAVDPNGNKIDGQFVKSVPNDPRYNLEENPAMQIPSSHGVGGVWRIPGVMNSAGLDTYFVDFQTNSWANKVAGASPKTAKFGVGNIITGILPVQEVSGTFNLLSATDAAHGGTAEGSNGTQYAPDGSPCAAQDLTICEAIRDFPQGYRFGMTIRTPESVNGWFHGRLTSPQITTSAWKNGEEISIEGQPVLVPSLNFSVPNAQIPDSVKKLISSGIQLGVEGDGIGETKISEDLSGPYTMQLLTDFAPAFGNKATKTQGSWSFRTLTGQYDQSVQQCSTNGALSGMVTTNALTYVAGPPTFDAATGVLQYKVASPHFAADGSQAVGTYDLSIKSDVARCIYKFTQAPIQASISIQSDDGSSQIATTVVSEKNGWLYLSAKGFSYSNPTIDVKLTQSTAKVTSSTSLGSPKPTSAKNIPSRTITCVKGKVREVLKSRSCPKGFKTA